MVNLADFFLACIVGSFTVKRYSLLYLLKIRVIDRKQEVPHDGPMCDLLWSDPEGNNGNVIHYSSGIICLQYRY